MPCKRRAGVCRRVILSHLLLVFTSLIVYGLFCGAGVTIFEKDRAITELRRGAKAIADRETAILEQGKRFDDRPMRFYEEFAEASVFLLDPDLQPLGPDDPSGESGPESYSSEDLERLLQRIGGSLHALREGREISTARTLGYYLDPGATAFAAVPVMDRTGRVTGGVLVARSVERLHDAFIFGCAIFVGALLITMVIAIGLSRRQARWLTRSLMMLLERTEKILKGDYSPFAYPNASEEIALLGERMNAMARDLQQTIGSLTAGKAKLEMILGSIGEGILALDENGRPIHWNDTFLNMLGLEDIRCIFETDREDIRLLLEACAETARTSATQALSKSVREGKQLAAEVRALPLEGEQIGSLCVVRDVSEAERMEQGRRRYVANISHELRTPLTGIRGLIEPLIDGYIETEEEKQECYAIILRETVRLQKLVGDMLDLSRLQTGGYVLETEVEDIRKTVREAIQSVAVLAREKQLMLEQSLPDTPVPCRINSDRLHQVLLILLDNAISYTPSGGSISVEISRTEDWGLVRVRDTGSGISPEELPYIWERFYKADASRTKTKGVGIGLSIAKILVELMGGEIHAVSEPGKGTEFSFTLPLSGEEPDERS